MRLSAIYVFAVLAIGCGSGVHGDPGAPPPDSAPDSPPPTDAPEVPLETTPLGMNDISMLQPDIGGNLGRIDGIDSPRDLVPRALYARLATSHLDIANDFDEYFIFAIRFDLCDRTTPGPCPEGADGSLRLVFQPQLEQTLAAADVGLHAFYTIPAAELGFVVNELRAIARLEGRAGQSRSPLSGINSRSLAGDQRLNALLNRYATTDRLIRLSLMGQDARSTVPHVVFRGLELRNGEMVDVTVATLDAAQQDAALTGADPGYDVTPVADSPANFALALTSGSFNAATPADQRNALEALVATQNPLLHTAATVQCIACHTSTYLAVHRGQVAGIPLADLSSRFVTTRDVRVSNGISAGDARSLHAFGWMGSQFAISQRVANETAVVLDEIERRFPVPAP